MSDRPDYLEIESRLRRVLASTKAPMPAVIVDLVGELIAASEYGVAVEILSGTVSEPAMQFADSDLADLEWVAHAIGMDMAAIDPTDDGRGRTG